MEEEPIHGGARMKLAGLAVLVVLAFAANSLFARAALAGGAISPGAYSLIRLAAGAILLLPLIRQMPGRRDLPGAVALLAYVVGFSLAYLSLGAATGALILFAAVQLTILASGLAMGQTIGARGWAGLALASLGITYLLYPSAASPPLGPALTMAGAGLAWGAYTMIGRSAGDAAARTARNFCIAALLCLPALAFEPHRPSTEGIALAAASGALTSGLGYILWYQIAPRLPLAAVAAVQLATPLAAAAGGAFLLGERLTPALAIAAFAVLGGIALTFIAQTKGP